MRDRAAFASSLCGPSHGAGARSVARAAVMATALCASAELQCGRGEPADVAQRGWVLYDRMCAVCHGRDAKGYAADQAPALANREFLASASDPYLRDAIASGRGGTTMSAWGRAHGGPLGPADVDAVVVFLRTWAARRWPFGRVPRPLDERPLAGDPARGAEIYARDCQKCHGDRGVGGPNVHIGGAELLASASNGFLRYAVRRGRPGTAMPSFEARLGDGGVEDVVAVLRSWQPATRPALLPPPARVPPLPLGPVPLNPRGPEPVGFRAAGEPTHGEVIKAQLDRGARMALLDARAPSDYVAEHIAGAVSVPFYDPAPYFAALPKDAWLVCYCGCPHAESGQLAQKLVAKGFKNVTVLDEGLPFWRAKKYPTRSGMDP